MYKNNVGIVFKSQNYPSNVDMIINLVLLLKSFPSNLKVDFDLFWSDDSMQIILMQESYKL